MKKAKRNFSKEENKFTPQQLKQLDKLARSQNNEELINKEQKTEKTYVKTNNIYPLRGVYLLEYDDGLKIGMSANIQRRIRDYNKPWCRPVLRSIFFYCENFQDLEVEVLQKSKKYLDFTVNSNEWITGISFDDMVNNITKIAIMKDCKNQAFRSFIESKL